MILSLTLTELTGDDVEAGGHVLAASCIEFSGTRSHS
jgi:hypothetical protein